MARTYKQTQDYVILQGNYGEADRTRVKEAINMAWRDVKARSHRWRWQEASAQITVPAGMNLSSNSVVLLAGIKQLRHLAPAAVDHPEPRFLDWDDFENRFARQAPGTVTGAPRYFSIRGAAELYFWPTADREYKYDAYFYKTLPDFTADVDVVPIYAEHEDVLVYGALKLLAARDKDLTMVAFWEDQYEGKIREMKASNEFKQKQSPTQVPMARDYRERTGVRF